MREATAASRAKSEFLAHKARILLVEDYQTNQRVATQHLHSEGYHVDLAKNGEEAVRAFAGSSYDLVLMDSAFVLTLAICVPRRLLLFRTVHGAIK